MKFSNSRTLPGHDQLTSARIASEGILSIVLSIFEEYFLLKCRASKGMSSGMIPRSGGVTIGKTFSR